MVLGAVLGGCTDGGSEDAAPSTSTSSDVEVGGDGSVSVESEEGSVRVSAEGELPADFPVDIPLPSAPHRVVSATETEVVGDQDASSSFVVFDVAAAPDAVAAQLAEAFGAAGFALESDQEIAGAVSRVHQSSTLLVTVLIGPGAVDADADADGDADAPPSTALSYTVIPGGAG